MHSLQVWAVVACAMSPGVNGAVLLAPPSLPVITPAPTAEALDVLVQRQEPDALSFANLLLTAVPATLRQIAATNIPAVSSILWAEFLNDNRPEWFNALPQDVKNYLIREFGPSAPWPTDAPSPTETSEQSGTTTQTDDSSEETSTQWSESSADASQTSEQASQTDSDATSATSLASTRESESTSSPASASSSSSSSSDSQSTVPASRTDTPTPSNANPTASSSTASSTLDSTDSSPTSSKSTTPDAPLASTDGLSKNQKIGLGVGIPLAVLSAAALFLGCCTVLRRRRQKRSNGSVPPSSPGFIPRFAFHDQKQDDVEHRAPLNRQSNRSMQDFGPTEWDDDGVDPMDNALMRNSYTTDNPYTADTAYTGAGMMVQDSGPFQSSSNAGMSMLDSTPVMTPALFHTHSSNRARGMRTSYTSLHSVAEVSEPDETDSPALGHHPSPKPSPSPKVMPTLSIPAGAQIKRKPVGSTSPPTPASPSLVASPAAYEASRTLLRQSMPEHSNSSSSGFNTSSSSGLGTYAQATPPVSPISNRPASNPFAYDSYVEDYGPEYQGAYVDVDDGLYGGHRSLSAYPDSRKRLSRTEWPLKNFTGSSHRRKSSPMWDRIYEE